ncbi:hypothetical protein M501DRAFT_1031365 [Patellaria atrata CBS 101060]|uniref:Uncharacterized protein n=1 Tax=Patellaria atrata CBS 101060 TaxID=1346257 RepID=A0A9P4VRC6_9PEZI|nr:hypothetical protein M501DRAFT_1031365 [Patellaria atrata CBS 101060]
MVSNKLELMQAMKDNAPKPIHSPSTNLLLQKGPKVKAKSTTEEPSRGLEVVSSLSKRDMDEDENDQMTLNVPDGDFGNGNKAQHGAGVKDYGKVSTSKDKVIDFESDLGTFTLQLRLDELLEEDTTDVLEEDAALMRPTLSLKEEELKAGDLAAHRHIKILDSPFNPNPNYQDKPEVPKNTYPIDIIDDYANNTSSPLAQCSGESVDSISAAPSRPRASGEREVSGSRPEPPSPTVEEIYADQVRVRQDIFWEKEFGKAEEIQKLRDFLWCYQSDHRSQLKLDPVNDQYEGRFYHGDRMDYGIPVEKQLAKPKKKWWGR